MMNPQKPALALLLSFLLVRNPSFLSCLSSYTIPGKPDDEFLRMHYKMNKNRGLSFFNYSTSA